MSKMKAVILAGGMGTRISEESQTKPKPMIEIGGKPILWHILKIYSHHGINNFVICCGYKGYMIKEYFANYFLHNSDVTFDLKSNSVKIHQNKSEPWNITLVDTGEQTLTGGRLKRVSKYIGNEDFCFTYGDGLSDLNLNELISFHKKKGALATLAGVQPPGRFGALNLNGDKVINFKEKPDGDGGWINGGFFILSPKVLNYIENDQTIWEKDPIEKLSSEGNLFVFKHSGFWMSMDTMRDKNALEAMWEKNNAPWKVWED